MDDNQRAADGHERFARSAVVTGGASGIGLAIAHRFLRDGASVVVGDYNERNGEAFLEASADAGYGDRAVFVRTDVSVEADVERMVATSVERFGCLDVVVNNAGIGGAVGAITDLSVEDWDYTFGVLARGAFLGIKHGAAQMIRQGEGGSIINVASVAGLVGDAGPLCYSSAKAAVVHLSRSAAVELAPHRIRVNAVCPGTISTPMLHGGEVESTIENLRRFVPWPSIGEPEEIAGAVRFLAGPDASYVTGDVMIVDGGMTAVGPGLTTRRGLRVPPPGLAGLDLGSTGEKFVVRRRPDA